MIEIGEIWMAYEFLRSYSTLLSQGSIKFALVSGNAKWMAERNSACNYELRNIKLRRFAI